MITGLPIVSARKRLRSLDIRHGIWPSRPITPLSAAATMRAIRIACCVILNSRSQPWLIPWPSSPCTIAIWLSALYMFSRR